MPSLRGGPTPTPSPFLQGGFAPVGEADAEDLEVIAGAIPDDLVGVYVRNGPNPALAPRLGYHWFGGAGMLHRVHFRGNGNGAGFRNRFVRTVSYLYQMAYFKQHNENYFHSIFMDLRGFRAIASLLLWNAVGWVRKTFKLSWLLPANPWEMKDLANTNIVAHAHRTFALVESGPPTEVKIPSLETVGVESFSGNLQHPFTAHPKTCPLTGEMIFFGYSTSKPHCVVSLLDKKGIKGPSVDLGLEKASMMHDCAITKNFVVVLDLCVIFDPKNALKNNVAFQYDPDSPARVGLVRRSAITDRSISVGPTAGCDDHNVGRLRRVPVEWFLVGRQCISFHVLNAFEDEATGGVVLDIVVYSGPHLDMDLARLVANAQKSGHRHETTGGKLVRWVMRHGDVGVVEQPEAFPLHSFEFPVINNAYCGLRHRFGYCAVAGFSGDHHAFDLEFRGVAKIDYTDMSMKEWHTDEGERNDEFVFVPKKGSSAEDDGYLVGFTVCAGAQRSNLVILDAATLSVVCRLRLPQRVPHGFHGNWINPNSFS
jgi:carotenoid cleavage dioxygenase-like enzyme